MFKFLSNEQVEMDGCMDIDTAFFTHRQTDRQTDGSLRHTDRQTDTFTDAGILIRVTW